MFTLLKNLVFFVPNFFKRRKLKKLNRVATDIVSSFKFGALDRERLDKVAKRMKVRQKEAANRKFDKDTEFLKGNMVISKTRPSKKKRKIV